MKYTAINFNTKLDSFSEQWQPKIIAQLNDYLVKVVKIDGVFVWHRHIATDEMFLVIDGTMRIEFRDGNVPLNAGDMYIVPKGVEHRPIAEKECRVLMIEPVGTVNTGDADENMTAPDDVWI